MSFRTTLILLLILLGLGAFAYFYEYKGGQEREKKKEQEKTLLEFDRASVTQIELDGLEKPVKLIPETGEKWSMVEPMQTRADETTVGRILSSLEKFKYEQVVEEQPSNLADYGLDQPALTVRLTLKPDNRRRSIEIGSRNPVGNVCYIRMNNDPRIYLVDAAVAQLSAITLFELRDKKLTDFVSEKVETLSVRTAGTNLEFKKDSGVWKMVQPLRSPASDNEVSSLLSSLEFLRAAQFIDQPSEDLNEYGLKDPSTVIDILQEKGLRQRILFGAKQGDQIYARVEGGAIALVSDSFSPYFGKKPDEWREKKVTLFNRFDATEVKIKSGGKEYLFKKPDADKWVMEIPQKGEIENDQIQGLLEHLESAEITRYGEESKLEGAPVLEISMTMKDWQDKITRAQLAFGAARGEEQPVHNSDYNTVVWTSATVQKEMEKALGEIKPKPPEKKQ